MKKIHKLGGILLIILIVIIFINNTLSDYTESELDILTIIGEPATRNISSLNEYTLLVDKTIGVYLKYVQDGEYEKAYALITPEYKEVVTLEMYKEKINKIDFSSYTVTGLVLKTENMYVANLTTKDNIFHEFLIIIRDDSFAIVPEPFLKYVTVENDITRDNVTYMLKGYEIDVNKCIFDISITNNNNEEVKISSIQMYTENDIAIHAQNGVFSVAANSTIDASVVVENSLEEPVLFEIERDAENQIRTYKFKLK